MEPEHGAGGSQFALAHVGQIVAGRERRIADLPGIAAGRAQDMNRNAALDAILHPGDPQFDLFETVVIEVRGEVVIALAGLQWHFPALAQEGPIIVHVKGLVDSVDALLKLRLIGHRSRDVVGPADLVAEL